MAELTSLDGVYMFNNELEALEVLIELKRVANLYVGITQHRNILVEIQRNIV